MVNISYMGTKRELAPVVANVIRLAQEGIFLDVFSGMCSVGEQVGATRQVWCNDIQVFSAEVANALFTSHDEPPQLIFIAETIYPNFEKHQQLLTSYFRQSIEAEQLLVDSGSFEEFLQHQKHLANLLATEIATTPANRDNLFCLGYSNNYFGIQQAIEIDAIFKSISLATISHTISVDQRRWLLIALGRSLLRVANTTGHFAQYLKPKEATYKKYLRLRRRVIWEEWLSSTGELNPVGHVKWRKKNKCFNEDSLELIPKLGKMKQRPAVVYADPPYTDDQYSRFYHLLETLILYDYPTLSGIGLYRGNRFTTPFSLKSKVVSSFDSLVEGVAAIGADLVLSYPTNGLLYKTEVSPLTILRKHYKKVEICYSENHEHSTFGASKGNAKSPVTEVIYLAEK